MSDFASESGHWYKPTGEPCYTIAGKNGNERPTTLRDARTLGLLPSVTMILQCASKPALEAWKIDQGILAALTLPRNDGESEAAWLSRVKEDARAQSEKARADGALIHGAIEQHYRGLPFPKELAATVEGVELSLAVQCGTQQWQPERSFSLGNYGGKLDLHSDDWLIDFKGKDFEPGARLDTYDEHHSQLAAYRRGIRKPKARCAILFYSRSHPGVTVFREVDEKELLRGLAMFDALLDYWYAKTGLGK